MACPEVIVGKHGSLDCATARDTLLFLKAHMHWPDSRKVLDKMQGIEAQVVSEDLLCLHLLITCHMTCQVH